MFSTISSYIWGEETTTTEQPPTSEEAVVHHHPAVEAKKKKSGAATSAARGRSRSPQDWVMIGADPNPGNLAASEDDLPPVSSASSVNGEAVTETVTDQESTTRVPVPRPAEPSLGIQTNKCLRQAQLTKQRNTNKALSSKALKRANKAVNGGGRKENVYKHNLPIKSAGFNKNLKQC